MKAGELLLRHQHLDERISALEDERVRLNDRLTQNPEVDRLRTQLDAARAAHEHARHRLESMDREMNVHLSRMRAHERELMSGRVRNPSDLTRMSSEVEHMKAALADEENTELEAMADVERTEAEVTRLEALLRAASHQTEAERPNVLRRADAVGGQIEQLKAERESVWEQVPAEYRAEYRRLARVHQPVAEVSGGVCQACHVALTPSELQQVKRGDHLVTCQNCSRILVAV